ncbi:MAG: TetR/AcrR family transcriptional regulator [Saccharothrix sp.]|nr:TetR/AcrR family transcriptional regulator [Saccharothrix sp.]
MPAPPKPLRADAARNRAKLLAAAVEVFATRGLDAPLEHIARQAGVSIGTLYAHFPTRDALFDAIFPERLAALDRVAAEALADPDPWLGFVAFLEGVFALQAEDRGLNDAISRRVPMSGQMEEVCTRGVGHAETIIARAREAGKLRADFTVADLAVLTSAVSQVIRTAPEDWRRFLCLYLDGVRA